MNNQKTRRKKYKKSFQYVRMPVSRLKRIKSPRSIITKYNGNKVKILKLSREKTGHIKNKKLEREYFSGQSRKNWKLGCSGDGGHGEWAWQASLLQSHLPAKNN